MKGSPKVASIEYHVSRDGEMFGPFSETELRDGVRNGRFAASDFVHATGETDWQPLGPFLMKLGPLRKEAGKAEEAVVPGWRSILKSVWARWRADAAEGGLAVGAVCVLLGLGAFALSRWPVVFWAPWLIVAAVTALVMLVRGRKMTGAALLLAVISLPWGLQQFLAKMPGAKRELIAQNEPVEFPQMETSQRQASVAPVAPSAPASAAVSVTATPTPAPESLLAKAGKLADSVMPFINHAKDSLPKLPDFSSPSGNSGSPENAANADTSVPVPELDQDTLTKHRDSIYVVKGLNGTGNGFACRVGDQTWLFSNTHLLATLQQPIFSELSGMPMIPGAGELAPGPNIVRFAMAKAPEHVFEMMTNLEQNVQIGDGVAVLGNAKAGGVVAVWNGVVQGIGPDRIEVSAWFAPANSGSPIVHLKTGKVIAIAAQFRRPYDEFGDDIRVTGSVAGRHFGLRIDQPQVWEPMNWSEFSAEADSIDKVSRLTEDLYNLYWSAYNHREPHFNTDTLRVAGMEWQTKMNRKDLSAADHLHASQTFLDGLRFMTRGDVNALDGRLRYTYFRNQLASEKKIRERLSKKLDEVLEVGTHKAL